MAKPIKETPLLKGNDAKKFRRQIEANNSKKTDSKVVAKMQENFRKLHSIAQF